ncbi:MAG: PAS domain S-box protein [Sandaracinus sp.]
METDHDVEEGLWALFLSSPTPAYLLRRVGTEFILLAINPAARLFSPLQNAMLGMVGKPLSRLYADQPEALAAAHRAMDERKAIPIELQVRRFDRTAHELVRLRLVFAFVPPDLLVLHVQDATGPTELEQLRRSAELRHAAVVSSMLEAVLVVDAERSVVLSANEPAARLFEVSVGDLIGRDPATLAAWIAETGDSSAPGQLPWNVARAHKVGVRAIKLGLVLADGRTKWCLVSAQPIPDPLDGAARSIACTLTDVTEREASLVAMRESERRYRDILESTSEGVWSTDLEGNTLFVNRRMAELLRTTVERLATAKAFDFFDDAERARLAERFARRRQGLNETFEVEFICDDGTHVVASASASPVWAEGRVVGSVAMFRDLTEVRRTAAALQRSERWLEVALEAAKMGVFEWEPATNVGAWSPHLGALFGPDVRDGVEGFLENIHPDDLERVGAEVARVLPGPAAFDVEYRHVQKNGAIRWIRATGRHVVEPRRDFLTGTLTDVTDRVRLEEALSRGRRLESLGRLAGGVAHDFNNLLTVILASITLAEDDAPPSVRDELDTMRHAAERARDLTKQLLAFARRQVVELENVSLDPSVRAMSQMLARLLGDDIRLTTRLEASGGYVRVDVSQLEQVVVNLAVNARDALPRGGSVELATRLESVDAVRAGTLGIAAGNYAVFSVRDDGEGIDAATREHLFEPFFTTKPHGTGLGLATSYGIARQLGGTIHVESTPGHGARFDLYLPRVEGSSAESDAPSLPATPALVASKRILLVDDDPLVRNAGRRILERLGHRVLVAASGESALELVATAAEPIELLVTDVMMPGMSGPELLAKLRERQPSLPAIVVSGHTDIDLERIEGAIRLPKPYTIELLAESVRQALG